MPDAKELAEYIVDNTYKIKIIPDVPKFEPEAQLMTKLYRSWMIEAILSAIVEWMGT